MPCCVCLLETHKKINSFDNFGIDLNVAEIVNKHLWFKVFLKRQLKLCYIK